MTRNSVDKELLSIYKASHIILPLSYSAIQSSDASVSNIRMKLKAKPLQEYSNLLRMAIQTMLNDALYS